MDTPWSAVSELLDHAEDAHSEIRRNPIAFRPAVLRTLLVILGVTRDPKAALEDQVASALRRPIGGQTGALFIAAVTALLAAPRVFAELQTGEIGRRVIHALRVLAPDLIEDWRVGDSESTEEQLLSISAAAHKAHSRVATIPEIHRFPDDLARQEAVVLRLLNDLSGRHVFAPALPTGYAARLQEYYRALQSIAADPTRESLALVERLHGELTAEPSLRSTPIGRAVTRAVVESGRTAAIAAFDANPLAHPTSLTATFPAKRYPLLLPGAEFDLLVEIFNRGSGTATGVSALVDTSAPDATIRREAPIAISKLDADLGNLAPGERRLLRVRAQTILACDQVRVTVYLQWGDAGSPCNEELVDGTVRAQRAGIEWDRWTSQVPYSLEPVLADELCGRNELLASLTGHLRRGTSGGAWLWGQKRVGKTSIARAVAKNLTDAGMLVSLVPGGYKETTTQATQQTLGDRICREIRRRVRDGESFEIPDFSQSFSPLEVFLRDIQDRRGVKDLAIILDEFDEIPVEMWKGPFGDAFFEKLRALSSLDGVRILLVGAERMPMILEKQGQRLNKWTTCKVTYFDETSEWNDYTELIVRPTRDVLDFSQPAIHRLYRMTLGNPYFTKLICAELFSASIRRRDSDITLHEVDEAASRVMRNAGSNAFAHYWDDGIPPQSEDATDAISRDRRRVLLAVARSALEGGPLDETSLEVRLKSQTKFQATTIARDLQRREILNVGIGPDRALEIRVPILQQWLQPRSVHELLGSAGELTAVGAATDTDLRPPSEREVEAAASRHSTFSYQGTRLSSSTIWEWLGNFADPIEKRLMLRLVEGLVLRDAAWVRSRMAEIVASIDGKPSSGPGSQARRYDIVALVTGGVGKSCAMMSRILAEEAKIPKQSRVIDAKTLGENLSELQGLRTLVVVDDLAATGQSLVRSLRSALVDEGVRDIVVRRKLQFVVAILMAHPTGEAAVQALLDELLPGAKVCVCEQIAPAHMPFSPGSGVFASDAERVRAKEVAERYGSLLVSNAPLGFGGLELGVAFEHSCPNNSLPILWRDRQEKGRNASWTPLLRRKS